ncbi:MAG: aspartate kinase [Parafilimonas sp.]
MKFGGTSVGTPQRMNQVLQLITADDKPKIVVLSALSGTTNALVNISNAIAEGYRGEAAKKIEELEAHYRKFVDTLVSTEEGKKKANAIVSEHFEFLNIILKISFSEALNKDILAQGELLSTKLFSVYLEEIKEDHILLPALEFMSIDAQGEPQIGSIKVKLSQLLQHYPKTRLFVTQGYICRNSRGEVDNLKRGGSDYTASLIAAALNAEVCEIWTDISGLHNNDPRIVDKTVAVEYLSFDEAAELAYFGAKILHPACIWPARSYNIPVKLLNTMEPQAAGTTINQNAMSVGVKAVAAKDGIIAIKIKSSRMLLAYGFLRKVFEVFEKYQTSIDMVTTSEVAVSLTIDNDTYLNDIIRELEMFGSIEIDKAQTIVSIVGYHVAKTENLLAKVFDSLTEIPVRMVSFGGSQHNISILVAHEHKEKTLQLLSHGLFD